LPAADDLAESLGEKLGVDQVLLRRLSPAYRLVRRGSSYRLAFASRRVLVVLAVAPAAVDFLVRA